MPLYEGVGQTIRQRIKAGQYKPNETLPSLRTLGVEFRVSTNVIYRALKSLETDKLIVTQHGKGALVMPDANCINDAIFFGAILPLGDERIFASQIILHAEKTFDQRRNLMFIRSSQGQAKLEREVTHQLVRNGVSGILLWSVKNDPNGEFFDNLRKKIPVVLVDRILDEANLPAVVMDYHSAGADIVRAMLGEAGRKRLLVVIDNLNISNYSSLADGMQDQARKMGRFDDVSIIQLPLTDLITKLNVADYSDIERFRSYVAQQLQMGEYDAVFCPQEEFIESIIIETDLHTQHGNLLMGSMTGPLLTRSRKYYEAGVMRWLWDFPKMISTAVDELQKRASNRKQAAQTIAIPIPRVKADASPELE